KWNFDRMMGPDSKYIVKAQLVSTVKSVQVIEKYTLQMNLVSSSSLFFENGSVQGGGFLSAFMTSPAYAQKVGDTGLARAPMGTGPFKLAEWVQNDHITATKFDGYWEKDSLGVQRPYLDQVTIKPIADTTVLFNALRTGGI